VLLRPQPCPVPLQVATARVELWAEGVKRGVRTTSAGITPPVAAPPSSVPPTSVPTSAGQGKRSDYAEPGGGTEIDGRRDLPETLAGLEPPDHSESPHGRETR
jgi:hypothetical protein